MHTLCRLRDIVSIIVGARTALNKRRTQLIHRQWIDNADLRTWSVLLYIYIYTIPARTCAEKSIIGISQFRWIVLCVRCTRANRVKCTRWTEYRILALFDHSKMFSKHIEHVIKFTRWTRWLPFVLVFEIRFGAVIRGSKQLLSYVRRKQLWKKKN